MRWYLTAAELVLQTIWGNKQFSESASTGGTLVSLTLGYTPGHGKKEG